MCVCVCVCVCVCEREREGKKECEREIETERKNEWEREREREREREKCLCFWCERRRERESEREREREYVQMENMSCDRAVKEAFRRRKKLFFFLKCQKLFFLLFILSVNKFKKWIESFKTDLSIQNEILGMKLHNQHILRRVDLSTWVGLYDTSVQVIVTSFVKKLSENCFDLFLLFYIEIIRLKLTNWQVFIFLKFVGQLLLASIGSQDNSISLSPLNTLSFSHSLIGTSSSCSLNLSHTHIHTYSLSHTHLYLLLACLPTHTLSPFSFPCSYALISLLPSLIHTLSPLTY